MAMEISTEINVETSGGKRKRYDESLVKKKLLIFLIDILCLNIPLIGNKSN